MSRQCVLIHRAEERDSSIGGAPRDGEKDNPLGRDLNSRRFVQAGRQLGATGGGRRQRPQTRWEPERLPAANGSRPASLLAPTLLLLYLRLLAVIAPTAIPILIISPTAIPIIPPTVISVVIVPATTVAVPVPTIPVPAAIACFLKFVAIVPSLATVIAVPVYVTAQSAFLVSDVIAAITCLRGDRGSEEQCCAERKS